MPNFCSNCGAKLSPNAKFCSECGSPITASAVPVAEPVASVAVQPVAPAVQSYGIEEAQTELYMLYKILEPAQALESASNKVGAKIAELNKHRSEVNSRFHRDLVYYVPYINVRFNENLISPSDKNDIKSWKAFCKRSWDYKCDPMDPGKYDLNDIFRLLKQNKAKVLKDRYRALYYYKLDYCLNEPQTPSKYVSGCVCDHRGKNVISNYPLINYDNFISRYLPKQLGDKYDDYIVGLVSNGYEGDNHGEFQLHDIVKGYGIKEPAIDLYKRLNKVLPVKKELDGAVAALGNLKAQIDGTLDKYMCSANDYIDKNIKVVPESFARNRDKVAYLLHLIADRRGRDIYEIVNQYELDMKHKELTSALADIGAEISSQTRILGGKLDRINRSVVQASDKIMDAIGEQTEVLDARLEGINYSVICSGASVTNAVTQVGKTMLKALGSLDLKVNVSI